jgi:hypothetical protein
MRAEFKVTSLKQTALNDKSEDMRPRYLPIYPSEPHRDSKKLLFLQYGKLSSLSYIQLEPVYKVFVSCLLYPREGRDLVLFSTSYHELVEASGVNLDTLVGRRSVSRNMPPRPLPGRGYGTNGEVSVPRPPVPYTPLPQPISSHVRQPVPKSSIQVPISACSTPSGTGFLPEYHNTGRKYYNTGRTLWRWDWDSARRYLQQFCLILGLLIWTAIFLSLCYGIYVAGAAVVRYVEMSWHYLASLVEKLIKMVRG